MAHGTPDWGITAGAVTTYQLTDLGELAARLGSPITHDRRGDVIWWDDFEWGLAKWGVSLGGTGAAGALGTTRARNGRQSAKLTAGSDGAHSVGLAHDQAVPLVSLLGAELSFSLDGGTHQVALAQQVKTATGKYFFAVWWIQSTGVLQYEDSAGALVTFATGVNLGGGSTLFHTMKAVVDPATGQYVRVIVNATAYSLAGIPARVQAGSFMPLEEVSVTHIGRALFNDVIWVDDVILTQNEPP